MEETFSAADARANSPDQQHVVFDCTDGSVAAVRVHCMMLSEICIREDFER